MHVISLFSVGNSMINRLFFGVIQTSDCYTQGVLIIYISMSTRKEISSMISCRFPFLWRKANE